MFLRSEALPYVLPVGLVAAATASAGYELATLFLALLTASLGAFFRDPQRESDDSPSCILSPADGKVVEVSSTENGIEIEASLQPTSFIVGDTVTMHIEASSPEGISLSILTQKYGSFTELRSNELLDIPDNDRRRWIWTKAFDTFDATVTTFPSIPTSRIFILD